MYRFLWSPRWLVTHLVLLAVVATCVSLGVWQLRRLDERRAFNALVTGRLAAHEEPVAAVLSEPADRLAYRRVTVTGRYAPSEEVLLSPRSRDGAPGHDVLTPLVTGTGGILVDRGWVPFALSRAPVAAAAPPPGEVRVTGYLLPSRHALRAGPVGAARLGFVSDADIGQLQRQVSAPLAPVYLVLTSQSPAPGPLPRPGTPPELDEGPHQSYAVQWFLFACVAVVGYPFLIRRRAWDLARSGASPGAPPPTRPQNRRRNSEGLRRGVADKGSPGRLTAPDPGMASGTRPGTHSGPRSETRPRR
ncbi:MAG: SURF1 family cytochrome oxidase biogenesis protein [Egibacteraceae bacterium]